MNYLLDTHALIWYLEAASDLSSKATLQRRKYAFIRCQCDVVKTK